MHAEKGHEGHGHAMKEHVHRCLHRWKHAYACGEKGHTCSAECHKKHEMKEEKKADMGTALHPFRTRDACLPCGAFSFRDRRKFPQPGVADLVVLHHSGLLKPCFRRMRVLAFSCGSVLAVRSASGPRRGPGAPCPTGPGGDALAFVAGEGQ